MRIDGSGTHYIPSRLHTDEGDIGNCSESVKYAGIALLLSI